MNLTAWNFHFQAILWHFWNRRHIYLHIKALNYKSLRGWEASLENEVLMKILQGSIVQCFQCSGRLALSFLPTEMTSSLTSSYCAFWLNRSITQQVSGGAGWICTYSKSWLHPHRGFKLGCYPPFSNSFLWNWLPCHLTLERDCILAVI